MNILKQIYCRFYQFILHLALPFLPYKETIILKSEGEIGNILKKNNLAHPLIITGKNIFKRGLCDELMATLDNAQIRYSLFSDTLSNPTVSNVWRAKDFYLNEKCDSLIAIGGGSCIDLAKAVGALLVRPKKNLNELAGVLHVRRKIPLLFAIPSTAGTGSEVTIASVIVDEKASHKYAINDFSLIPSYAVLNPNLTKDLPASLAAQTGMDALTHAIEAYIGRGGNKKTREDALEASRLILGNIYNVYTKNDDRSRKNMLYASYLAGRAFSKAYVGYVHALSHALSGKYNLPHGYTNAIILPIVLKEYKKGTKKLYKLALNAKLVNKDASYNEGKEALINKILELNHLMNIPDSIDINPKDIKQMAFYADKEANPLYPVPEQWSQKRLVKIYYKIGKIEYNE